MSVSAYTRRQCFRLTTAALAAASPAAHRWALAQPPPPLRLRGDGNVRNRAECTLSIGTYSLKGMALEEAITKVAAIGYDGIEIAAQSGFDGEPSRMTPQRRTEVRRRLDDTGLQLTALMEQLTPTADDTQHLNDLGRLRRVLALSRALAPRRPPLVQTVLGGGLWEEKKTLFRDRLGDWQEAAEQTRVVLAIKPHRGGALSRPDEAIWLIRELGDSPWLRMVYDYSHYAYRDMPLEETVKTALPYTAHVVVKDAVQQGTKIVFALPGESGTFDYAKLLRLFYDGGYRGDVCCEVSSQVSKRVDFDPAFAAKTCYESMARAFEAAHVPRA
jgi:sugar phosphate isomerase/epimerase